MTGRAWEGEGSGEDEGTGADVAPAFSEGERSRIVETEAGVGASPRRGVESSASIASLRRLDGPGPSRALAPVRVYMTGAEEGR